MCSNQGSHGIETLVNNVVMGSSENCDLTREGCNNLVLTVFQSFLQSWDVKIVNGQAFIIKVGIARQVTYEVVKMAVVEFGLEMGNKAIEIIDPVVKVVFGFRLIGGLWWSLGETIRAMRDARDMYKCKIEGEDRDNPPIDTGTGFEIWVMCIYFNYQVPNANKIHFERLKGIEEAIEFELGLEEL
ncbi:hypothetical protein HETIRDRAFT_116835 [Heterobasidion irregulare TC 32-1]|uniref:Uncharacterized protein n=1 Tax=Heterobasidion irregulare (strain TC 32-1) TaxID=747525 RepID=W4KFM1_HETIT|nr:uncharacterized protein HETIRDRAFT_116835 [Heterobasidion irregulare TC 32-1]ETW84643.1 hypothetical protein HETIRDRAFT_116835 [Heterobasidion irregulare TC 32-1]